MKKKLLYRSLNLQEKSYLLEAITKELKDDKEKKMSDLGILIELIINDHLLPDLKNIRKDFYPTSNLITLDGTIIGLPNTIGFSEKGEDEVKVPTRCSIKLSKHYINLNSYYLTDFLSILKFKEETKEYIQPIKEALLEILEIDYKIESALYPKYRFGHHPRYITIDTWDQLYEINQTWYELLYDTLVEKEIIKDLDVEIENTPTSDLLDRIKNYVNI